MSDLKIATKTQAQDIIADTYVTLPSSAGTFYLPITPPAGSGAQFYGRDVIEIVQGNASNISKTELCFDFRTVGANTVQSTAEYGQAANAAFWVDVTNRVLWIRFYMVAAASDKAIVRHYNPYTIIGAAQADAPAGAEWTNYKFQVSQSQGLKWNGSAVLTQADNAWA
jgi:hypothetical protein